MFDLVRRRDGLAQSERAEHARELSLINHKGDVAAARAANVGYVGKASMMELAAVDFTRQVCTRLAASESVMFFATIEAAVAFELAQGITGLGRPGGR